MSVEHLLKTWPQFFDAAKAGQKPFELRKDDRNYTVGDTLTLQKFDPATSKYVGEYLRRRVTYVLRDAKQFGLEPGFCILGLAEMLDDLSIEFVINGLAFGLMVPPGSTLGEARVRALQMRDYFPPEKNPDEWVIRLRDGGHLSPDQKVDPHAGQTLLLTRRRAGAGVGGKATDDSDLPDLRAQRARIAEVAAGKRPAEDLRAPEQHAAVLERIDSGGEYGDGTSIHRADGQAALKAGAAALRENGELKQEVETARLELQHIIERDDETNPWIGPLSELAKRAKIRAGLMKRTAESLEQECNTLRKACDAWQGRAEQAESRQEQLKSKLESLSQENTDEMRRIAKRLTVARQCMNTNPTTCSNENCIATREAVGILMLLADISERVVYGAKTGQDAKGSEVSKNPVRLYRCEHTLHAGRPYRTQCDLLAGHDGDHYHTAPVESPTALNTPTFDDRIREIIREELAVTGRRLRKHGDELANEDAWLPKFVADALEGREPGKEELDAH